MSLFATDIPEHFADLCNLADHLNSNCTNDIDERVWEIARQYDNIPIFGDIYVDTVCSLLNNAIQCQYEHLNLRIDWYVNCLDSHFYVNDTEIFGRDDFYNLIDELEQQVA